MSLELQPKKRERKSTWHKYDLKEDSNIFSLCPIPPLPPKYFFKKSCSDNIKELAFKDLFIRRMTGPSLWGALSISLYPWVSDFIFFELFRFSAWKFNQDTGAGLEDFRSAPLCSPLYPFPSCFGTRLPWSLPSWAAWEPQQVMGERGDEAFAKPSQAGCFSFCTMAAGCCENQWLRQLGRVFPLPAVKGSPLGLGWGQGKAAEVPMCHKPLPPTAQINTTCGRWRPKLLGEELVSELKLLKRVTLESQLCWLLNISAGSWVQCLALQVRAPGKVFLGHLLHVRHESFNLKPS